MFDLSVNRYNSKLDFIVHCPSSLNNPVDNSIMFVTKKYIKLMGNLKLCKNCLVFVPEGIAVCQETLDRHCIVFAANPRLEYAKLMNECILEKELSREYTFSDSYYKGANVYLAGNVSIGPFCVIGNNVIIGEGTVIKSGAKILDNVRIGANCIIRENAVIGSDGFGFEKDENGINIRIPHFGGVIIEDDVEIGANSVVAQGTINPTVVRKNTKVDGLAMIAHNDDIGESCIITGGAMIGGSVAIGSSTHLGPNCSIMNKATIGSNALIGLGTDVFNSVKDNCTITTRSTVAIWEKGRI